MTREELLTRISSQELTGWLALFAVQADEAKHQRDVHESSDGIVIVSGLDDDPDDDDSEEPGAE